MDKFRTFLKSLETSDNRATLEAISRGYKACFESFYMGAITSVWLGLKDSEIYVEFFINPSADEIKEIKKTNQHRCVRGIVDDKDTIYAWNGDVLHEVGAKVIKKVDILRFITSGDMLQVKGAADEITDTLIKHLPKFQKMFPETKGIVYRDSKNWYTETILYEQIPAPATP